MSPSWLVIGLGNPGPRYDGTRHNVGADVIAELCRRAGEKLSPARGQRAELVRTRLSSAGLGVPAVDAQTVILMRSRTYMNESGIAVSKVASFAGITLIISSSFMTKLILIRVGYASKGRRR